MKQAVIIGIVILTVGMNPALTGESAFWKVRSYMENTGPLCQRTAIELVLRSDAGALLGTHRVTFADGVRDEEWSVGTAPGSFTLELYRIDCGGVRASVAELETEVSVLTEAKQVYIAAAVNTKALDPRFMEVDTYTRSTTVLSARREGASLVIANTEGDGVHFCGNPALQTARDEYLLRGEWKPAGSWVVPPDLLTIAQGGEIALRRAGPIYVPPDRGEPTTPEAARTMLAIKPGKPTHVRLGEIPRGFLGFPGCDFVYVPRSVTPHDRIWPQGDAEP